MIIQYLLTRNTQLLDGFSIEIIRYQLSIKVFYGRHWQYLHFTIENQYAIYLSKVKAERRHAIWMPPTALLYISLVCSAKQGESAKKWLVAR